MRKKTYPILEIKKSLKKIEAEVIKLKRLTQGIPAVEKNIAPVMAFIDILKSHLENLKGKEWFPDRLSLLFLNYFVFKQRQYVSFHVL